MLFDGNGKGQSLLRALSSVRFLFFLFSFFLNILFYFSFFLGLAALRFCLLSCVAGFRR